MEAPTASEDVTQDSLKLRLRFWFALWFAQIRFEAAGTKS